MRGVFWSAAQRWSVRLSTLVSFILLSRLLTPAQFGVVALAMVFITLVTVVTDAGFSLYLVHVDRLTSRLTSTAFWISLGMGLTLGGLLAGVAWPLAAVLEEPLLRQVLPVLSVAIVLASLSSVPAALLNREMEFRAIAVRQVSSTLVSVVVAVALAFAGAGVWALVAQTLTRSAVAAVVLGVLTPFRPSFSFSRREAWVMTAFGTKTTLVRLAMHARDQGEALVIGVSLGTVSLGLWAVAGRLVAVVSDLFGSLFGSVANPVFARMQHDPPRLARTLGRTQAAAALVLVPAMLSLALTSHVLVPLVSGPQWESATRLAAVLAVYNLVLSLSGFDRSVLQATGRVGTDLIITVVMTSVHLLVVVLVAPMGLDVLAAVLVVEIVLFFPVRPVVLHRVLGVPWGAYSQTLRILLAGGLSAGVVLAVLLPTGVDGWALLGVVAGVGALSYSVAVWLLARSTVVEVLAVLRDGLRRRSRNT